MTGSGDDIIYAGEQYYKNKNGQYLDENGNVLEDQEDEKSRVINPNGFKILTSKDGKNIYKLYNNGDLYGKGLKGIGLQTSEDEMKKINSNVFQELKLPSQIPNPKKIIQGNNETLYVLDENDNLWAFGKNDYNKLGLSQEKQEVYTGYEPVKLDLNGKKAFKIFDLGDSLFVVTTGGELYAAGRNQEGTLGIGSRNSVDRFTEVKFNEKDLNCKNIYNITGTYFGVFMWYNDSKAEEFTEDWYSKSKFYFTGVSPFCYGTGIKKNDESCTTFRRVWYNETSGGDIDQDIKCLGGGAGTIILKKDGSLLTSGYLNYDGGLGLRAGDVSSFVSVTELSGVYFKKFWYCVSGFACVGVDENDNIWFHSRYSTEVLGDFTINYKFHKLDNVPFKSSEIQEVLCSSHNFYFLLNDGRLFACGDKTYLGLGDEVLDSSKVFYLLNGDSGIIGGVSSLFGGKSIMGDVEKSNCDKGTAYYLLFVGEDKKVYVTGNSLIMFRDNILEKSWVKIAQDVKFFDPEGTCYINNSGELFVAGENSLYLGLKENTGRVVEKFTQVSDFGKNKRFGEAVKVVFGGVNTYVLNSEGILYATGLGSFQGQSTYAGWDDNSNKNEFVEILNDVLDFDIHDGSRTGKYGRVAVGKDGTVYGWGWKQDGMLVGTGSLSPKALNNEALPKPGRTTLVKFLGEERCFAVTEDGELFICGWNKTNYYDGGRTDLHNYFVKYTELSLDTDEKVIDLAMNGTTTDLIILTDKGRVFGYGQNSSIGLGNSTDLHPIVKLDIDSISSISGGNGFFIAVKDDGTVLGTGDNSTGALGRWSNLDNVKIDGRYQTAFQWVECTELEF